MNIRDLENKIVTDEEFAAIEEHPEVEKVENNGNSGKYSAATWWTAYLKDGSEFDFYTVSE